FRLPNVFGPGARPNYNSVVATFCHNIARDIPVCINDPSAVVILVYIEDVVQKFISSLFSPPVAEGAFHTVQPQYTITVGELAAQLQGFRDGYSPLHPADNSSPLMV